MLLPGILVANVGVPLLALLWPAHWLALVPLAVFEGELGHRRLQLARPAAMRVALFGNLVSTCVGVPLVWALMLAVEFGTSAVLSMLGVSGSSVVRALAFPLTSAWIGPTDDAWRVYLAFAVQAVPCCLASIAIESMIARRMLAREPQALRGWITQANLMSYLLLLVVTLTYPLASGGRAW
jgi:hypothetical protein